jgi:hypothetical protein
MAEDRKERRWFRIAPGDCLFRTAKILPPRQDSAAISPAVLLISDDLRFGSPTA